MRLQPISPPDVEPALRRFVDGPVYLHLETTAGAYTEGGFGAFARNVRVRLRRARVAGEDGRFRAGMETEEGWVYVEGLTHWELDDAGRLLLAGYDAEGRVTAVCELSPSPFPMRPQPRRIRPAPAPAPADGAPAAPPTAERAVLVVVAHPDDETFGLGGTIALYARAGVPVTCAVATGGEMGRQMGSPFFATRETLSAHRARELEAACAALGVQDLRLLGHWDKTTEFEEGEVLIAQVLDLLREVRPSLLLTSHPRFGGHPDHCAVGAAAGTAAHRGTARARGAHGRHPSGVGGQGGGDPRAPLAERGHAAAERAGRRAPPADAGDRAVRGVPVVGAAPPPIRQGARAVAGAGGASPAGNAVARPAAWREPPAKRTRPEPERQADAMSGHDQAQGQSPSSAMTERMYAWSWRANHSRSPARGASTAIGG
jgi:LmbE family N-acetylglucosaminyl deacetylase